MIEPRPSRVLVVAPSWLGDLVMATPALRALRAALPEAHVTFVCRPGLDRVLDGSSLCDAVIVEGLRGPIRAGMRLRRERFDLAVLFPNSFRSALAVRVAGVPRRVGYRRDGRGWLLSERVAPPSERPFSTVALYAELLERGLGIDVVDRRPRLAVTTEERLRADALLAELTGKPFALLIPGGNRESKRWPPGRFAAVADALATRYGLAVAMSGSPGERNVLDAVADVARTPILDLAARGIDLPTLKGVVASASLVIGNDTGPRHIALALGRPTITLFGPTDHRWTSVPGSCERLLVAEPFLPEELVADDRSRACAVDRIAIADVLAAAEGLVRTHCDERAQDRTLHAAAEE